MVNFIKKIRFNRIIILLTFSDIFTWGLYIVISAIAGIYLSEKLGANAIEMIGIGAALYQVIKGIAQVPIGFIADYIKGEKDDIIFLFFGNIFMGFPYLLYPSINSEYTYFFLQIIMGLGSAMNLVNWRKLFAKNLNPGQEGIEYGAYDAIMSLAIAGFSLAAGMIANSGQEYFDGVMYAIGVLIMSSSIWVYMIFHLRINKKPKKTALQVEKSWRDEK